MKSTGSRPPGEQSRFSWHLTQCESFRRYSTFRLFSEKITNLRREVKEGAISKELSLGCCSTSNLSLSMDTRAERPTWCDFSNEQLPFSSHRTHTVWELLPEGDVRGQQWPSSFRGRRRGRDDEVWHNPARRKNQQETALLLHRGMTHQYCQVVVAVTKCSLLLVFAQYLPLLLFFDHYKKKDLLWTNLKESHAAVNEADLSVDQNSSGSHSVFPKSKSFSWPWITQVLWSPAQQFWLWSPAQKFWLWSPSQKFPEHQCRQSSKLTVGTDFCWRV